jgi:hypothetical protein
MAAILSNRFFRRRTIPPLGFVEDQCSYIVLPRASAAGPGEPPYNLTESEFAARRVEKHDQLSRTTIQLSANPRPIAGAGRHRDYAYAVPYDISVTECRFAGQRIGRSEQFGCVYPDSDGSGGDPGKPERPRAAAAAMTRLKLAVKVMIDARDMQTPRTGPGRRGMGGPVCGPGRRSGGKGNRSTM